MEREGHEHFLFATGLFEYFEELRSCLAETNKKLLMGPAGKLLSFGKLKNARKRERKVSNNSPPPCTSVMFDLSLLYMTLSLLGFKQNVIV